MKFQVIGLIAAVLLCSVANAEDNATKKRKKNAGRQNVAAMVMKQLQEVELTAEQKKEIQAMAKESAEEIMKIRKDAGITAEVLKNRAAAQKELRESGKKGAELMEAVNQKAGLTEDQAAALKKVNAARQGLMKKAVALLTEEQKAKLPARVKRAGLAKEKGQRGGQAKGKKGKKATAE